MKPALALVEPPSCALAARWRRSFSFRLRDSDFRAGPLSPLPSPRREVRTTNFTLETAAHRVSRAPAHLQSGKRFFPGITQDVRTLPSIRVHIWLSGTLTAPLASNLVSSSESLAHCRPSVPAVSVGGGGCGVAGARKPRPVVRGPRHRALPLAFFTRFGRPQGWGERIRSAHEKVERISKRREGQRAASKIGAENTNYPGD